MTSFYYCLTLYHILCCVLHRMLHNQNNADIMISNLTVDAQKLAENLRKSQLFDSVYIFNDIKVLSSRKNNQSIEVQIEQQSRAVENELVINLKEYNNLYICADHFPLGIYCATNNISYNFFEDGCGQYSRRFDTINNIANEFQKNTVLKYNLFGNNDNIIRRFIDIKAQRDDYVQTNKDCDFSPRSIIKNLKKKKKKLIQEIFDINVNLKVNKNSVLFLPQHNVNLNIFTIEEQLYQTSLLLDYFAPDLDIYIKPHPNDCFTDYSKLGKNINLIPAKFPVELMLLSPYKFNRGITAWSTSIHSLSEILQEQIYFTADIDKYYKDIYRYYAATKIIQAIGSNNLNIYTKWVYLPLLENILRFCNNLNMTYNLIEIEDDLSNIELDKHSIFIIDDKFSSSVKSAVNFIDNLIEQIHTSPIIFINSDNHNLFFYGQDYSIYKNMGCWSIHKQPLYEPDIYSDIDFNDEKIWFYIEDNIMKNKIENVSYVKELPCSKIITYTNTIDENFQMPDKNTVYRNIKMLEGILEATQSRLDSEIKEKQNG